LGRIPAAAVFRVPTQSECRRSEAAHLAFLPVLLSTRHSVHVGGVPRRFRCQDPV